MMASTSPKSPGGTSARVMGYWAQTWKSVEPLPDANLGIAFSGYADPKHAIPQSEPIKAGLKGQRYLSLGGGARGSGAFDSGVLESIRVAMTDGRFAGYAGIAYDVEVGASGLASAFARSFAMAKDAGFSVLVTVSHSAPYGVADAHALMESFLADPHIDFLSPQLYTTGFETENDYATSAGVPWSSYAHAEAAIVPSINRAELYSSASEYFGSRGVQLQGFIQWR